MISNEELKRALKIVYDERFVYQPDREKEIIWNFSEEYHFEKKMEKLIKARKHSYWKYVNTLGKRAAVVILFIIFAFSSAMTVPAFREPVVEFIVKAYEKFSEYYVDENTLQYSEYEIAETIEEKYAPTDIPYNYVKTESYEDEKSVFIVWNDNENNEIRFYQKLITTQSSLNTEHTDIKQIELNDFSLYMYTQNGATTYLWEDYGYSFVLRVPESMTADEASAIIQSVNLDEKQ